MKKKKWTTSPIFFIFSTVMLAMALAVYNYNHILSYVEIGIAVASSAAVLFFNVRFHRYVTSVVKSGAQKLKGFNSEFLERYKMPVAFVGSKDDILWCNSRFIKDICGGGRPEGGSVVPFLNGNGAAEAAEKDSVDTEVNGREFTVYCVSAAEGYICYFIDNTDYRRTAREYRDTRPCVAVVTFDNADTFSNISDEAYAEVALTVQSLIQKWAAEYDALFKLIGTNRYMVIFRDADVDKLIAGKFQILKQIHSVKVNQITATVSIGLCRGVNSIRESEVNARKALDMALGRGGDQAAIIYNSSYEFFGGASGASEKINKVRMRVIANAISKAASDCDKIFIMGHRFSDLDCLGAAVGMQAVMEKNFGCRTKIVLDREKTMADKLVEYAEEKLGSGIFVTPDEALKKITQKSLLMIVDTHLRDSLECPELYDACKKVIVIDHHRRAVNYIDNAIVFCHEPFASSACEMCSEIISCLDDKALGYVQADALLSGIMLDTKSFVVKTGVRTFEAAAYLRKKGANTLTVKHMFSASIDTYKEKVNIVCGAVIYKRCAISSAENSKTADIRLASAQAADELLTLEDVKASFVIFRSEDKINISARSFGEVNVQIIMEKLGGGGHQNMAAAQLENATEESALESLVTVIDENLEDAVND